MQVQISDERQAQISAYAQRHGQDLSTALDEVLATALDFEEAVEGIRQGYEDVKAGRTRPASEMFEELREKYGFPR